MWHLPIAADSGKAPLLRQALRIDKWATDREWQRRAATRGRCGPHHPERYRRVVRMVDQMQKEGFGACSNEGECEAVCPKEISTLHIQIMQRDYLRAVLRGA